MPAADLLAANAPDEVTQAARLEAAKGKNVLWLTCFYTALFWEGLRPSVEIVHKLGANLYVVFNETEADRGMRNKMEALGLLAGAIFCDMGDDATAADNVVAAAKATGVKFDAVFSPHEHAQTLVGELSERMGLPGNPASAYVKARNKFASRDCCTEAGIAVPGYAKVATLEEAQKAGTKLGFPLVLKPMSGAASAGVVKCYNMDDLVKAFESVSKELQTNELFSWNPGCEAGLMLESFIDGDEFDVDLLLWDGNLVYGKANDNAEPREPYFLEDTSNAPTVYPDDKHAELVDYALKTVLAMGFKQGCFHVECKYTHKTLLRPDGSGQPMLIENNPRMGGGRTNLLHKETFGVDLFVNFFLSACGIPINPPRAEKPLCGIADYFVCAPKTGVLLNTRYLDHIKAHPNVIGCGYMKQAGDSIKGLDTGMPEWIGFCTVKAEDVHVALALLAELVKTIDIPITAPSNKSAEKGEHGRPMRRESLKEVGSFDAYLEPAKN